MSTPQNPNQTPDPITTHLAMDAALVHQRTRKTPSQIYIESVRCGQTLEAEYRRNVGIKQQIEHALHDVGAEGYLVLPNDTGFMLKLPNPDNYPHPVHHLNPIEKIIELEQERWQKAIHAEIATVDPAAVENAGGSDSGDPLDYTLEALRACLSEPEQEPGAQAPGARDEYDRQKQHAEIRRKHICVDSAVERLNDLLCDLQQQRSSVMPGAMHNFLFTIEERLKDAILLLGVEAPDFDPSATRGSPASDGPTEPDLPGDRETRIGNAVVETLERDGPNHSVAWLRRRVDTEGISFDEFFAILKSLAMQGFIDIQPHQDTMPHKGELEIRLKARTNSRGLGPTSGRPETTPPQS